MNTNLINYGKATYSVAMIDLDNYLNILTNLDSQLKEPNFVLEYVLKNTNYEAADYLLKDHALTKFAKIDKDLENMKKAIIKYQKKLEQYLANNQTESEEFNKKLDILIPLHEEYSKLIKAQIKKCFEFIKSHEYLGTCDEV